MAGATLRTICGIQALDRGRIEPGVVVRLNAAAKFLVASRRSHWTKDSVGLACTEAPAGAVGSVGIQSSECDGGRRVLVFDGRVDNRHELLADLHGRGVDASADDGELILTAYEEWGDACVARLVGDFAFGLWDDRAGRLLCARDPLGVRPLYVLMRDDRICFATQLRQLLAICPGAAHVDLEYVADRLALGVDRPNGGLTPYRGLSAPGAWPSTHRGQRRASGSSGTGIGPERDGCSPVDAGHGEEEYVERFLHTFHDAVACRMSGAGAGSGRSSRGGSTRLPS